MYLGAGVMVPRKDVIWKILSWIYSKSLPRLEVYDKVIIRILKYPCSERKEPLDKERCKMTF